MNNKAIVFDYNGVLANDLPIHARIYAQILQEKGIPATEQDIWKIMPKTGKEKIQFFFPAATPEQLQKLLEKHRELYLREIAGKDILFPETHAVIPKLAKKFKLAIISHSTRTVLDRTLSKKLQKHFKKILTAENLPTTKPDPAALQRLMQEWKIQPDQCRYVGDSTVDIQFAKNAGCKAIGITTGENTKKELKNAGADKVINSLEELIQSE